MIEMEFLRKHRDFDKGTKVRVISVYAVDRKVGGSKMSLSEILNYGKSEPYVKFEYDCTSYDLETSTHIEFGKSVVITRTFVKNDTEHASWFFSNDLLRKAEVIMDARDEVEIEKLLEMTENTTCLDLREKHKGSIKGKKFGL